MQAKAQTIQISIWVLADPHSTCYIYKAQLRVYSKFDMCKSQVKGCPCYHWSSDCWRRSSGTYHFHVKNVVKVCRIHFYGRKYTTFDRFSETKNKKDQTNDGGQQGLQLEQGCNLAHIVFLKNGLRSFHLRGMAPGMMSESWQMLPHPCSCRRQ